jgi:hypothetical protein
MRIPRSSVVGLDDEEVCWAVVDPIWPTVETEDELALLDQGTNGQQAIYATMLYAQEVDNGGLKQFFGNSSGMLWEHVRSGLLLLGAQEHLDLIAAAIEIFPRGVPSAEQSERRQALQALTQDQRDLWRAGETHLCSWRILCRFTSKLDAVHRSSPGRILCRERQIGSSISPLLQLAPAKSAFQ